MKTTEILTATRNYIRSLKDNLNISDGKSKEYFKQLHSKAQYRLSSLIGKNKISKTRVDLLQKELNQVDNFEQLDEFNKKLNRY